MLRRRESLPRSERGGGPGDHCLIEARHHLIGDYLLACEGTPDLLFTENESNAERLWGLPNRTRYVKDGIDAAVAHGRTEAVNPNEVGTKVAAHYRLTLAPGETRTILLRLSTERHARPFADAERIFALRRAEADAFHAAITPDTLTDDERLVQRQAIAGLIWTKQYYNYDVGQWLDGDPCAPPPPAQRSKGRNCQWRHINNGDVVSMPDKWEYPWYAAWDLAFHTVPLAIVDPAFAKSQLVLLLREWYMHPNGQLPAYEWAFGDVNPPVHAWAAWRVYKTEQRVTGQRDRAFLARIFHKLLLNFTWWVNRKDAEGRNVFQGGFLGLDNISVFDRSTSLPPGVQLEQSDGTAWMATYCLSMATIALELDADDPAFEDVATKFLQHFFAIGGAMNGLVPGAVNLWHEEDGFYYDELHFPNGEEMPLRVRSLVGLIPMIAAVMIEPSLGERAPDVVAGLRWVLDHHPELAPLAPTRAGPDGERRLLTLVPEDRLRRILRRMLDPNEFLSDFGIRSISKAHAVPSEFTVAGQTLSIRYEPAESSTAMFGGNSNWRGPIWFPINYLLIGALRRLHGFYGDTFTVEYTTGSGRQATLREISDDIARRLVSIFLRGPDGRRPVFGGSELFQRDPHWRDYVLFYEYFHGDNGAGIGASHQTGWTSLVASVIDRIGRDRAATAEAGGVPAAGEAGATGTSDAESDNPETVLEGPTDE